MTETLDRKILRCIINKAYETGSAIKWSKKYEHKILLGKLLREWNNLAEKLPSVNENNFNADLRDSAHFSLHAISMHVSAKAVAPKTSCGFCHTFEKKAV